jgi:hypothetical protein
MQALAPFAPLFSDRVWRLVQVFLLGAMLTPGARTVTAALRVMGLLGERHVTNSQRVVRRAAWSARHGSRTLLGALITLLVPSGATIVLNVARVPVTIPAVSDVVTSRRMMPLPVEADLQGEERWTTHLDRKIIDHVIVSPEVRVVDGPWVYAFDRDGAWLEAVGVSADWFEAKSYQLTPERDPPMTVENLHRVSDHRPVWASVALD